MSVLTCFGIDDKGNRYYACIGGILGALIAGILILGAAIRNATAIIVWIVFAVIKLIFWLIVTIAVIVGLAMVDDNVPDSKGKDLAIGWVVFGLILAIVEIIYTIWSIYVAKKAIDEIREGQ